jgi:hypothetical protein
MTNKIAEIRTHEGKTNTNILLIAPHGHVDDDENTGILTREIRKKLDCHAIVNEVYRKPKELENGSLEEPNKDEKILDLNNKPQAEDHEKILEKIKKLIEDPQSTYVFWIHGIKDENLTEEANTMGIQGLKGLVGYGQPDRHSMNHEKAQALLNHFKEQKLEMEFTREDANNYRGWSKDNLNQWFKNNRNGYFEVQSVQLEFAFTGVRDNDSIDLSSQKIAYAITKLVGAKLVPEQEAVVDAELVDTAYSHVRDLINNNNAMLKIGQYLIETFYAGKYDLAKEKQRFKNKSLMKVFEKLNEEGYSPAKTWFYNAVKLAVDEHEFKDFRTYGKLGHSHKVYLTHVEKFEDKKKLIDETVENKYTVKEMREKIRALNGSSNGGYNPIPLVNVEKVKEMPDKKQEQQIKRVKDRKIKLEDMIKRLNEDLTNRRKEKKACEEWLNQIGQTDNSESMLEYARKSINSDQEGTEQAEAQPSEQANTTEQSTEPAMAMVPEHETV